MPAEVSPSARRVPICALRCLTIVDSTPYSPMTASSPLMPARALISCSAKRVGASAPSSRDGIVATSERVMWAAMPTTFRAREL